MFNLGELNDIRDKIANDVYKDGMRLVCNKCKKMKDINKKDFAEYLADGWPECCDETMELIQ